MNYSLLFKIFSYIPFISTLSLLLLVFHAYFLYGHMPTYSKPDPKSIPFTYILYSIFDFLLIFSFFYYPILIMIIILKKEVKKSIFFKNIAIYVLGLILLIIIYRLDDFGLAEWIND